MFKRLLFLITFVSTSGLLYGAAAKAPALGQVMFNAVMDQNGKRLDDENLTRVISIARSKGYTFDSQNNFNSGELVLVRRSNATLAIGRIIGKNETGSYSIEIESGASKDELPQYIGKFPAAKKALKAPAVPVPAKQLQKVARSVSAAKATNTKSDQPSPQQKKPYCPPAPAKKLIPQPKQPAVASRAMPTQATKVPAKPSTAQVNRTIAHRSDAVLKAEKERTAHYWKQLEQAQSAAGASKPASAAPKETGSAVQASRAIARPSNAALKAKERTAQYWKQLEQTQSAAGASKQSDVAPKEIRDVLGQLQAAYEINHPGIKRLDKTTYESFIKALQKAITMIDAGMPYDKVQAKKMVETTMIERFAQAKVTHESPGDDRLSEAELEELIATVDWGRNLTNPLLASLKRLDLISKDLYDKFIELNDAVDKRLQHILLVKKVGTVIYSEK